MAFIPLGKLSTKMTRIDWGVCLFYCLHTVVESDNNNYKLSILVHLLF